MAGIDPVLAAAYFGLGTIAMAQDRPQDADRPAHEGGRDPPDGRGHAPRPRQRPNRDRPGRQGHRAAESRDRGSCRWAGPNPTWRSRPHTRAAGDADTPSGRGRWPLSTPATWRRRRRALTAILDGETALHATASLGLVAELEGDTVAAADWFRKALALDPEDVTATARARAGSRPCRRPRRPKEATDDRVPRHRH